MSHLLDYTFICKSWWFHGKRKLRKTDYLRLRLEPENKHDITAVAITKDGRKVGYVPREWSRETTDAIKSGRTLHVLVVEESNAARDEEPVIRICDSEKYSSEQRGRRSSDAADTIASLCVLTICILFLAVLFSRCTR